MYKNKYFIFINLLSFFINIILYIFVIINLNVNLIYISFFYLSSFILLFYSFNFKTIFFEKFIAIFIWLGFPFKLAIPYVASAFGYDISPFPENSSLYVFSKETYDNAIIFSSFGITGFIIASIVRKKYIFNYSKNNDDTKSRLKLLYDKYTFKILFIYLINQPINQAIN